MPLPKRNFCGKQDTRHASTVAFINSRNLNKFHSYFKLVSESHPFQNQQCLFFQGFGTKPKQALLVALTRKEPSTFVKLIPMQ